MGKVDILLIKSINSKNTRKRIFCRGMGRRGYVSQRSKPQAPKPPFFKVDMALQIPNIVSDFPEKKGHMNFSLPICILE